MPFAVDFRLIRHLIFFDEVQHDGDITTTFLSYGCKLRDLTNATQVLTLLPNHHLILIGDSTNEAVYRGIL
jgi:hypothetical protein